MTICTLEWNKIKRTLTRNSLKNVGKGGVFVERQLKDITNKQNLTKPNQTLAEI